MLDGKILSAVLATLTAVAVSSSGGGDLSDQALETDPSNMEIDVAGMIKNPVKQLRQMVTTTPEPENSMHAELRADNIANETFQVEGARISTENATSIGFGGNNIESDENIDIYGYSGAVIPSNSTVRLSGNAEGVLTSGVNVSGTSAIENELKSDRVDLRGIDQSSISLASVSGSIESSGTSTEFDSPRTLMIDSFSGDISIRASNKTIILDGKVNRLTAGDFEFGN